MNQTKEQLLDQLHYAAGVLATLVLDGKTSEALKWAARVNDLNYRLNMVIPE